MAEPKATHTQVSFIVAHLEILTVAMAADFEFRTPRICNKGHDYSQ